MRATKFEKFEVLNRIEEEDRGFTSKCWIWTASYWESNDYGRIKVKGEEWAAHRFSFKVFNGRIPRSLLLDHICKVHRCVNPDHLRFATHRQNAVDYSDTSLTAINARKTHCIHGHELSGSNLQIVKRGRAIESRRCKTCEYDGKRRRRVSKNS